MSRLFQSFESLRSHAYRVQDRLTLFLFGANNERLDFLIDSFQKLKPEQQKMVYVAGGLVAGLVVVAIGLLYVQGVHGLKQDLYDSIATGRQLSKLQQEFVAAEQRFVEVVDSVSQKTGSISSYKNIFEDISRNVDIKLASLDEKVMQPAEMNLLFERFNEIKVNVAMDNIALPKFFKFVTQLEKSDNYLNVTHLTIRARYETKLYFDTKMAVRGYLLK